MESDTKDAFKSILMVGGVIVLVLLLLYPIGVLDRYLNLWFSWQTKLTEIFDADRVEQVRTAFIERAHQLESQKAQISSMDSQIKLISDRNTGKANWPQQDKANYDSLLRSRLDMVTNYNRSCAQYEADWDNQLRSIVAQDLKRRLPDHCELYAP